MVRSPDVSPVTRESHFAKRFFKTQFSRQVFDRHNLEAHGLQQIAIAVNALQSLYHRGFRRP
jgi:hypothetical protein